MPQPDITRAREVEPGRAGARSEALTWRTGIEGCMTMRVCVLGTGTMGAAIAGNLCRAGFDMTVWDRSRAHVAPLAACGAATAPSPAEAVADADVVITMLPDADAVVSVLDHQDALGAFAADAVWMQMGTIGLAATDRMRAMTAALRPDVSFVDAPVSGSKGPAATGTLLILASGPAAARVRLGPLFSVLARRTIWLGDAGRGMRLKLVLNTWLAFLMEGVAETTAVADELGITIGEVLDGLEANPLAAPAAVAKLHKIAARDYEQEFTLALALKDVELALGAIAHRPPALAAIAEHWHVAEEDGLGDLDVSAVRLALGPSRAPAFIASGR
jgi:3-hydroxyisobutyrate dehydrogenase